MEVIRRRELGGCRFESKNKAFIGSGINTSADYADYADSIQGKPWSTQLRIPIAN
jgi:hypothetical protein